MMKERRKKSVIIVDDHEIFVRGLVSALEGSYFLQVVKTFNDGAKAKEYLGRHNIDIIISDINMPGFSGFNLLNYVRAKHTAKVLLLSVLKDSFTIKRAYRLGVSGYLSKDTSITNIFKALDTIRKGYKYTNEEIDKVLLESATELNQKKEDRPLTPQEKIVLRKICEEKSSKQIAEELGISIHTINNHRKSILKKTKSTNLVSLSKYAAKNGLFNE